jgi:hypothetical protein
MQDLKQLHNRGAHITVADNKHEIANFIENDKKTPILVGPAAV